MVRLDTPLMVEVMDRDMIPFLQAKSAAEKIAMVGAANRTARKLMACGIRQLNPDWSEEQVLAEVARRMRNGST